VCLGQDLPQHQEHREERELRVTVEQNAVLRFVRRTHLASLHTALAAADLARPGARTISDVLGRPVRYERQSLDDFRAALAGHGIGNAVVEGFVDMMRAKDDGLDDGVRRTPRTASPTTFLLTT